MKNECRSIAFPLISSGIYGYPKDQALQVAISAIGEFLLNHEMIVNLVVYDKASFVLTEKLFSAIGKFIDDNYVEEHLYYHNRSNRDIGQREVQFYKNSIELNQPINSITDIIYNNSC